MLDVLDDDERRRVVDDRLQALLAGLALGLGPAALGDVDQLAQEVQRALAVTVHERDVHERVDHRPVGAQIALLDRERAPAPGEQLLDQGAIEAAVVGMAELVELGGAQLLLGAPEHLAQRAVQAQPAAVEVDERHADRGVVERTAEELLGGAQLVLDAVVLGDVLTGAVHHRRAPVLVEHDLAARVDHAQVAVGAHDPVVEAPRPALGERRLDHPPDAGAVVGMDLVEVGPVGAGHAVGCHAVDAVELVGPGDAIGGDLPLPRPHPRDLLGLGQLGLVGGQVRLRLVALGHVEHLADVVLGLGPRVAHEREADQRHHRAPAAVAHGRLELQRGRRLAQGLGHARVVDHVGEALGQQLLLGVPEQAAQGRVDPQEGAPRRDERHPERRIAEGAGEAVHEDLLAIGDVVDQGVDEAAHRVERRLGLDPAHLRRRAAAGGSGWARSSPRRPASRPATPRPPRDRRDG